jgi:phenylpyruvate tautomerase PptA (4-oxalocrotonate tautomerase family)
MTMRHPDVQPPRPGEVIRYAYLWTNEYEAGREEAAKDRPYAVVLTMRQDGDDKVVFVLPITSQRPALVDDAVEVTEATRRRLGLQDSACWVVLTEVNQFVWPGPDLRPVERPAGAFYSFGLLPGAQFKRIRDAVLMRVRMRRLGVVPRTE